MKINQIFQVYVIQKFEKCKNNIINQLIEITKQIDDNSFFFVSISGHGYQIKMRMVMKKMDMMNIYQWVKEKLLDDNLWEIFINNLSKIKKNIKFIGLTDTCHSGTMYDLAFNYSNNKWIKIQIENHV